MCVFQCDTCGKTWSDKVKFTRHVENAHAGEAKPKTKIRIVRDEKNKVPAIVPDVFFEVKNIIHFSFLYFC